MAWLRKHKSCVPHYPQNCAEPKYRSTNNGHFETLIDPMRWSFQRHRCRDAHPCGSYANHGSWNSHHFMQTPANNACFCQHFFFFRNITFVVLFAENCIGNAANEGASHCAPCAHIHRAREWLIAAMLYETSSRSHMTTNLAADSAGGPSVVDWTRYRLHIINVLWVRGKWTALHQGANPGQLLSRVYIIIDQHRSGAVGAAPAKKNKKQKNRRMTPYLCHILLTVLNNETRK